MVIAPLHDFPTTISNLAVASLKKWMNKNNINYKLFRGINANRLIISSANFINEMKSKNGDTERYNAVFYYGHGKEDRLGDIGIDILPIIGSKNIEKFKNMVIYTMSCLSGKKLAPLAIEKGVISYFGHNVKYFAFVSNKYSNNGIGNDNFVSDWITLVNIIPIRLMLGDSTGQAMQEYDTLAHQMHVSYIHNESNINKKLLYSNALHLELYGSQTARIV